ncbi:MAG: hypothetical protein AB7U85_02870 [Alphaproteobacteria bacterium]
MKALKTLLVFMFFVVSGCDKAIAEDNAVQKEGSVFEKLGYNPKWEEIPSVNEFKDVFLKTTGQSFDDRVNDCAYKAVSSIKNGVERLNSDTVGGSLEILDNKPFRARKYVPYNYHKYCDGVLDSNLNYPKKGHKLACKRSDFFRNLVEDGSSWFLSNKDSKEFVKNWFWGKYALPKDTKIDNIENTLYDPSFVKENVFKDTFEAIYYNKTKDIFICKAIAEGYGFYSYDKVRTKDGIKKIEKDTNIAQSQITLDHKLEPDYIMELDYNNDGKRELIHKISLHSSAELGCPNPDGSINFDQCDCWCDISGMKEDEIKPCDCDCGFDRPFVAIYENNIEEVKQYLKTPDLIIKDWYHYNMIKEKFGGEDLKYECSCYVRDFVQNTDFLTFRNETYIIDFIDKRNYPDNYIGEVLHPKGKTSRYSTGRWCDSVCYLKEVYSWDLIDDDSDYIKASVVDAFPIYYVNDDSYLYDESLLDEIKKISYNVADYGSDRRNEVEEYLKDKAKTLCNVDLDKVQYKPENKAKILKLRKDNGEEAVLDETKIVKNITIPEKQKICGLNQKSERCTLYILNNSGKEVTARHFYILASKETGLYQEDIMYINDGYNDAVIKPDQFAQINIPVPFYLYYIEDGTEQLYVKD